jgi:hypothetical protein
VRGTTPNRFATCTVGSRTLFNEEVAMLLFSVVIANDKEPQVANERH